MLQQLRKSWRRFRDDHPGQRFAQRYARRKRERRDSLKTLLYGGAGMLLILVGLFFMLVPGPGIPIFLAGAAFLAGESLNVARALDRAELWLRRRGGRQLQPRSR